MATARQSIPAHYPSPLTLGLQTSRCDGPKTAGAQGLHGPSGWWNKPGAMLRWRERTVLEESEGRGQSTSLVSGARRRRLQQNAAEARHFPEFSPRWRAADDPPRHCLLEGCEREVP